MAELVAHLLEDAPEQFVLERPQEVAALLQACAGDRDSERQISQALTHSVEFVSKTGTPGQPYPQDVKRRDKARELAQSLPPASPGRQFYETLHIRAEQEIKAHLLKWEEELEAD